MKTPIFSTSKKHYKPYSLNMYCLLILCAFARVLRHIYDCPRHLKTTFFEPVHDIGLCERCTKKAPRLTNSSAEGFYKGR